MAARRRKPQKPKQRVRDIARERGVYAVRRNFADSPEETLGSLYRVLPQYLEGAKGRLFTPETLGVTVIGASRFSEKHFHKGPPTIDVLEQVPSVDDFATARIGSLALFGAGQRMSKLGFCLESTDLQAENKALADIYDRQGFPLKTPRYEVDGFMPHCSVAILYADQIARFDNDDMLDRLDQTIGMHGQEITLSPVARN